MLKIDKIVITYEGNEHKISACILVLMVAKRTQKKPFLN